MTNWQGKTVLITGSSGFIGSHVADELSRSGADVLGIDMIEPRWNKVEFINFDVTSGLPNIERRIDAIFHLAAVASPNQCEKNPIRAFAVNVHGTYNMLRYAMNRKVKKFVFASSAFIYGKNPQYIPIDENHPISPVDNVYSITKKLGEDLCHSFENCNEELSTTIVRLFNVFGPRQDLEYLIPTIINQAVTEKKVVLWNSKPTRDFNYIENVVDALLTVGASQLTGIYNIGSGEEIRVAEVGQKIANKFGAEVQFLEKDVIGSLRLKCNNKRMLETFGWQPKVSFKDGLDKTVEWYQNNITKISGVQKQCT